MREITQLSIRELTKIILDVQEDEAEVAALFVNPRGYLFGHDVVIPMEAEITIQHRDELRAQLLTPARLEKFAADAREEEDSVTIHIKKPFKLRCGRITIKCPKKTNGIAQNSGLQAISDVPMENVFALIHQLEEASTSDADVLQLKSSQTRFFTARGLMSPPDVRINVGDTEALIQSLREERGVNEFLKLAEDAPVVKGRAHVKGGLANCTWIEYECEK